MSALPCKHDERVTAQVQPTIELLDNMDEWHPDVLLQHGIQPLDYKSGLVFRSAIESIRGRFIASSTTGREGLVADVLENMKQRNLVAGYTHRSSRTRYDFEVAIRHDPDYFIAVEVKGGEGNSINISERPIWAKEFCVWSHLDGAIINQPANGARSIVNRLANELVRREKLVDILFFKDTLCGTRARPCPKYPQAEETIGLNAAPDVFLFPQSIPSIDNPQPPVHTLDSLQFPRLILGLFGVQPEQYENHVWEVHVEITDHSENQLRRITTLKHKGEVVYSSASRPWRP